METLPPITGIVSIIDNSTPGTSLVAVLNTALPTSTGADACVGYLHLRGWDAIADAVEQFEGEGLNKARVLVGMHADPQAEMRATSGVFPQRPTPDGPGRARIQRTVKEQFERQLTFGLPSNNYQAILDRLNGQLKTGKVQIKLYTRQRLHAKLYLTRRPDPIHQRFGIVGSSNLTAPGLWTQGELNVAVYDQTDCIRLQEWFDERWDDEHTLDITEIVVKLIEEGWPNDGVLPFHVYLRMAYHVATDGLEAEREFPIPEPFDKDLFDFQKEAVRLAARKLLRENGYEGVLLADVVGLGKTFMASAVIKIFQRDRDERTLIICPKNLVLMWEHFVDRYGLNARVHSSSMTKTLHNLPGRFGCVVVDESHNLRNRETKSWTHIDKFVENNKARVMLLTATPLNKHYSDVAAQLRLFIDGDTDLGVRPTKYVRALIDEGEPLPQHPTSISAFEKSPYSEDWRELLRLFMVRRTRQYLVDRKFAALDPTKLRHFILDSEGNRRYFPKRQPKTLVFPCDDADPTDQYARLYTTNVTDAVLHLDLPRYGLAKYIDSKADIRPAHDPIVKDLGRAGRRLLGYCRMNLFKRLESSGHSFLLSIERHILRNLVFAYALENRLELPIGQQDPELLDPSVEDEDLFTAAADAEEEDDEGTDDVATRGIRTMDGFRARAEAAYRRYATEGAKKFRWLPAEYFLKTLKKNLIRDAEALLAVLNVAGEWAPDKDENLKQLHRILTLDHANDKVLVFTQFADTADYLGEQLKALGVDAVAVATGKTSNPMALAHRFSPESNEVKIPVRDQVRVLIATDVLSEGQNLQDCHVVVNYDLPWAIIRLIQRAGRVDRIGQDNLTVFCYSFEPQTGVENIIQLRGRLVQRLQMMGEVLGTDEQFLDETVNMDENLRRLYAEDPDVLNDTEGDNDLASDAMRIWYDASEQDRVAALALKNNAYATRHIEDGEDGVLVFARFGPARFGVARVSPDGTLLTESLGEVLQAAACKPTDPPQPRHPNHHDLVADAVRRMAKERRTEAGRLGPPREVRRRIYEKLRHYVDLHRGTLLVTDTLVSAIERIYNAPLLEGAQESIRRQMRLGVGEDDLSELVQRLYESHLLCAEPADADPEEPELICSMGLWRNPGSKPE